MTFFQVTKGLFRFLGMVESHFVRFSFSIFEMIAQGARVPILLKIYFIYGSNECRRGIFVSR